MQYKLCDGFEGIKRTDASGTISFVPNDSNNYDWLKYQAWLDEGNSPEPADD